MKKLMNITLALVLAVFTAFAAPVTVQARVGNGVGNGGDASALEFTWLARVALKRLESRPLTSVQSEAVRMLKGAIDSTRVVFRDRLVLRGQEVDAINYPAVGLIKVRRGGWAQMKRATSTARIGFVLHEYLGVAGVGDGSYQTSKSLVEMMIDERSSDVASHEHLLDSILTLKFNLYHTFKLVEEAVLLGKKYDPRRICFLAGFMAGQNSVMGLVVSNPRPWFIGEDPDRELASLSAVAADLNMLCDETKIDLSEFRKLVVEGVAAVERLSPRILAPFDVSKPNEAAPTR